MLNYITHGLVHKKGVGKQTSGQHIKGETDLKLARTGGYCRSAVCN